MGAKVLYIDQAKKAEAPAIGAAEIQAEFDELYAAFAERFRPLTPEKEYWIREAVSASIMRLKLTQLETDQLNESYRNLTEAQHPGLGDVTPMQRMALAWMAEAKNGSLEKIYKQLEQADNVFHRAHKKLMRLQKTVA